MLGNDLMFLPRTIPGKAVFKKMWAILGLFIAYFWSFQTSNTILQQINVQNVHLVSGDRIRTHNFLLMSLLL